VRLKQREMSELDRDRKQSLRAGAYFRNFIFRDKAERVESGRIIFRHNMR